MLNARVERFGITSKAAVEGRPKTRGSHAQPVRPDANQDRVLYTTYALAGIRLEFVEKNASIDGATVLICSDFPESNVAPMPSGDAVKDNGYFAPLSYYKLSVPVLGLPRAVESNDKNVPLTSRRAPSNPPETSGHRGDAGVSPERA